MSLDLSGVAGTPAALSPAGGSAFGGTPATRRCPAGSAGSGLGGRARRARCSPARTRELELEREPGRERPREVEPAVRAARGGASPRGDALERGAPHDAPSDAASAPPATGEARRVTPLELRRRDALEAKQRRLDGIMSRVAAARAPRDADARDGTLGWAPRIPRVGGAGRGGDARGVVVRSERPPSPSPDRSNRPRRNANPAREPREEAEAYSASPALSSWR